MLCLGAHRDDIEMGCGGALLHLANRGATKVRGVVLTGRAERVVEAEGFVIAKALVELTSGAELP